MGVFKVVGVAIVLLLCNPAYLPGVNSVLFLFPTEDMNGLQSLWAAWNTSTPSLNSNLLNWYTPTGPDDIPWPCYASRNWRGVTCLRYFVNASLSNTWVVGLELNDASISGILPPGINQLTKMVSLTLTGNPNLTGNLPKELADLPLNVLDLHDNGFNGTIPHELSNVGNLLELDLSGNQFSGDFPFQTFGQMQTLQVFGIAQNSFTGNVPSNAFENMTQLLTLDLSGNNFTGPPPKFNYTFADSTLYYLNLSRNSFSEIPDLSQIFKSWLPQNVGVLDLSGLNIGGALPADWSSFPELLSREELHLDDINVSGVLDIKSILSGIQNLSTDSNSNSRILRVLSLMNNKITDVIFDKQFLNSSNGQIKFYLGGNPYCATLSKDADGRRCFCEQYCAISEPSKKSDYKAIIIPTVISGVLLGAVILYLAIIIHRKSKYMDTLVKRFEESDVRAKRYEYSELRAATKNFSEERKLGQGAYGAVYKGMLTNNTQVAVKQLFMKTQQASEDFLNEILLITNLQHRNLVALKGYCLHGKEMLLVYEFVDFCDLDKLLFQDSTSVNVWQVLSWPARKRICLGVAQGLYYLHASSQTKIIHRDIKASNILLDRNLNAKIADFGLARPIEDKKSEIVTQQRAGTLGYVAPEYVLYGQLSEKADVYSFGVLLLEILSGARNKDPTQAEDDVYLPTRAWKLHKEDRLMDVIDPRLHVRQGEETEVRQVLETAIMCVHKSPEKRPTMFRVVAMLAGSAADEDAAAAASSMDSTWPECETPSGFRTEDPLLMALSSTTGSSSTGPITNGNATVELTTLLTR
uniref:Leucine-rich repeat receptor-like protein kinase n=1 Tax=Pohlia nutans TaxID=140635 RepID=A0A1P8DYU8_9BRYO|nr:leucine-rich repeat receptor-like protein kinase [Pohlia nutans]